MRINQNSGFLLEMVRAVSAGRVLPAAMQRPYVWSRANVEALCDSIMSGFPIGGFLLWAPGDHFQPHQIAKDRLGPIRAAAPEEVSRHYMLLLDGQNRLATLAWMMQRAPTPIEISNPSRMETETWLGDVQLVLDFESRSVLFVPKAEAAVGLRLPAWTLVLSTDSASHHAVSSTVRTLWARWVTEYPQEVVDEFMDLWDLAKQRFMGARITETVIEGATPAQAREAFMRICQVGVPMSVEDFDKALAWTAPAEVVAA